MTPPPLRVLIVDDDFMVGRIHRGFLQRMDGFDVAGEARTGAEALSAVRRLRPDIVLLDIYLPDIGGLEVFEQLRSGDYPPLDVIVVTAARDAETISTSLRLGALHYLIKPFGFDDLRERLEQVTALRSRLGVSAPQAFGQDEVDQVFGTAGTQSPTRRSLPKGLSEQTMKRVIAHFRNRSGDESATEFGDRIGLSRVSARRYLDYLVRIDWVDVDLRYGAVGRPERRYRWVREQES